MKHSTQKPKRMRNTRTLAVLILIGLVYIALIHFHAHLSGIRQIDGIFGVLLGLFTASHPAANALDVILYGRYLHIQYSSRQDEITWWGLNILVLLVGWYVIVQALLRYNALK